MDSSAARARLPAIDHLKAAAIIAVVFTHAGRGSLIGAVSDWDLYLTSVWVRYHVPTFLFVSGFLYARSGRADASSIGQRLQRVLVPYAISSLLVQLLGLSGARDVGEVMFQLLSGASLGIYYYVFVMVCCIALVWPLARLPATALWCVWLGLLALSVAMAAGLVGRGSLFVSMRNPFDHFYLGFFLSGWLVALSWPRIEAAYRRAPLAWGALCAAAIGYGWAVHAGWAAGAGALTRPVYTFGVIGAITMLTWRRPPGALVRFLSEASLCLYLYHRILQRLVEPSVAGWHPGLRIALLVAVGLGGGCLIAWAGRRLLGERRARLLLGT